MLLLDGYNVLFAGRGKRLDTNAFEQERERLLQLLVRYAELCDRKTLVIFDHTRSAPIFGTPLREIRGLVEIRFTEQGVSADDEIIRMVKETPDRTRFTVVSTDRAIRREVEARKVKVLTSDEFWADVKSRLQTAEERGMPGTLSSGEVEGWMREFGLEEEP